MPRFVCPACGRRFSRQSFAATYYMKRPELLRPIAALLVAGCAHRQIARFLRCAPSTVTRTAARLGRAALLLQAEALEHLPDLDEPVVFDHFQTFVFSQQNQLGIGTAVGRRTGFSLTFDPAPMRPGGRRAARRKALTRPKTPLPTRAVVQSTERVMRLLRGISSGPLQVVSDDHPAYPPAIRSVGGIVHRVFRNPPRGPGHDPAVARARDRAMRAADQLHSLIRHSMSHHRRETIAFARRVNAAVERIGVFLVWRNFIKGVSERKPDPTTPAMRAGLTDRPWTWDDVLACRRFPARIRLPEGWMRIYERRWITTEVGRNQIHELRHAF